MPAAAAAAAASSAYCTVLYIKKYRISLQETLCAIWFVSACADLVAEPCAATFVETLCGYLF